MSKARVFGVIVALVSSVAVSLLVAQGQAPAPQGRGGGGGGGQGRGARGGGPARGITVNLNVIQTATAKVTGEKITGTVEFNEFQVANGGLIQVVYNLQGVPAGMHGVHIHTVG